MSAVADFPQAMRVTIDGLRAGLGVEDIAVREGVSAAIIRENVSLLRHHKLLRKIYRRKGRAA